MTIFTAFQANALNILLTNDDGYEHPWINVLFSTLVEAGHHVTMSAPTIDQSGKAASLTLSKPQIDNPAPNIYAVDATPASSVLAGLQRVLETPPDLIVSGINEGANIGVLSSFSGTVGAVVAAMHFSNPPIPGIAISANLLDKDAPVDSEKNRQQGEEIASFLVRLIALLESSENERGGLLPPGIALNVNYPALTAEAIKGVGVYPHGRKLTTMFRQMAASRSDQQSTQVADEKYLPINPDDGAEGELDGDIAALLEGYITIVPIDGDYTAANWQNVFDSGFFDGLSAD